VISISLETSCARDEDLLVRPWPAPRHLTPTAHSRAEKATLAVVAWDLRSWRISYRSELGQTLTGLGLGHTLRRTSLTVSADHRERVEHILASIARRRPDLGLPLAVPTTTAR
jgi:hypothetical protein